MSPRACSSRRAGELGRGGVDELDVPGRLALVLTPRVFLGVEPRDRVGDQPVHGDRAAAGAVGEPVVDPPRRFQRERWVCWAARRACHAGIVQGLDPAPQPGEAVGQVEGVGQQLGTGGRGHAHRGGEGFGGERRDRRRALAHRATRRGRGRRAGWCRGCGWPPRSRPSRGAGRTTGRPAPAAAARPSGLPVRWRPRPRAPCPGRGRPPCSWHLLNHRPPTPRWPQNPLSTRVSGIVTDS